MELVVLSRPPPSLRTGLLTCNEISLSLHQCGRKHRGAGSWSLHGLHWDASGFVNTPGEGWISRPTPAAAGAGAVMSLVEIWHLKLPF